MGWSSGCLRPGRARWRCASTGFRHRAYLGRLLPALAAAFHAVAPFMRGYAPTAVPDDGAYHLGALAADAVALHEVLGGGADAALIGHDWGAEAAYAPDRWRRLVTLARVKESLRRPANLAAAIGYYRAAGALGTPDRRGEGRCWLPHLAGDPRSAPAPRPGLRLCRRARTPAASQGGAGGVRGGGWLLPRRPSCPPRFCPSSSTARPGTFRRRCCC